MSSNKKTIINLICSLMVLATNIIINFWLSPFIVKNIGVEANGFVTLANNFVTYAQLIVTALNSMAARFIAISYVKKDYKKANLYYNSVFWGNLIIVAVLIIPAIYFIARLENIINVPQNIITDVKLLFSFVFFNFFITTGLPNWDCGTYVTNRLDRSYIPQMIASIVRCAFLILIFMVFSPKVYYVGIAATILTVINLTANCYNTHKLTPELKLKRKIKCSKKAIVELVGSGIWNAISNVGNMLLSGLDLVICNLFLGATNMGILSLSKIIPNYMQQLSSSIRNAFAPELTINYASDNKEAVLNDIGRAMKITSIILTIPIAIVVVLGEEFFKLWVPSQDAKLLQILSILSILGYMFTSGTQMLFNVFTTVNKVKPNAIAMIVSGVCSTCITIFFIKFTNFGGKISTKQECIEEKDNVITYRWIISDTGIGMSKEFLKHIFEPFAQERADARSNYHGTGLGMAIVKKMIDKMGGTISVTSEVGKGSTFVVELPFEMGAAPEKSKKEEADKENSIHGLNLMLVEDNELNAEVAEILLEDEGAIITMVNDGQQAVELFNNNPVGTFDAILMDIMMPVMDGLTATKAIRALNLSLIHI